MRVFLRNALPALALASLILCTPAFAGMVDSRPVEERPAADQLSGRSLAEGVDLEPEALGGPVDSLTEAGTHGWIIAAAVAVIVAMIIVIVVVLD